MNCIKDPPLVVQPKHNHHLSLMSVFILLRKKFMSISPTSSRALQPAEISSTANTKVFKPQKKESPPLLDPDLSMSYQEISADQRYSSGINLSASRGGLSVIMLGIITFSPSGPIVIGIVSACLLIVTYLPIRYKPDIR